MNSRSPPRLVTDRERFLSIGNSISTGTRIPVECRVTVAEPFEAYRRARQDSGGVYLASTGGQSGWGYFGVDPVEQLTVYPAAEQWAGRSHHIEAGGNGTSFSAAEQSSSSSSGENQGGSQTATGKADNDRLVDSESLAALSGLLEAESLTHGDCDVPFPAALIGWLSYDIARELEDLPSDTRDDRNLPRLQVALYDTLVAWPEPVDDEPVELRVTACPRVEDPQTAFEQGRKQAFNLAEQILTGKPERPSGSVASSSTTFESEMGREMYEETVRQVKDHIRNGDTFQANISHRLTGPAEVHPVAVFDALRSVNPAPYSALLEFPDIDLISASPELLLEVVDDHVRTEPIAGTRPRGATRKEDDRLESELLNDEKERAEHAMLVDLERNDLGKVCEPGSVEVSEYRRVDKYAEVMHLVSLVEGRLRPEAEVVDAIAASFPGGTITGAPKPRTMEIIEEMEASRRGPYTGSIGLFGFDGRATLNIVIRTLVKHATEYHLRVGAGIVHDSVPAQEYDETLDKAEALVAAVDAALSGQIDTEMLE